MPNHKAHLAIAKLVNEKINMDLDSIMLGSVLPDICNNKVHSKSHFQVGEKDLEGLANPDKFVKKYKNKLSNPTMIGYLIHILTDRYYNEYLFKHFYIYDKDDNCLGMYLKGKQVYLNSEERKHIKHRELDIYDKWLMNHGFLCKFKDNKCINNVIDIDEAKFDKERLESYVKSSNKDLDKINIFSKICFYNYKITNKKELDKIFNGCIKYVLDYLFDNVLLAVEVGFKLNKDINYYKEILNKCGAINTHNYKTHDMYWTNKDLKNMSENEMKNSCIRLRETQTIDENDPNRIHKKSYRFQNTFNLIKENEYLSADEVNKLISKIESEGYKKVFDTSKTDYQYQIGDMKSMIQLQNIENVGLLLYYDNPDYYTYSLDEQRKKIIDELNSYGFNFKYGKLGLDKLRTLYYGKEMYSKNQNG